MIFREKFQFVIFLSVFLSFGDSYYYESEDSLREDLGKLLKGEIDFSTYNSSYYENELIDHTPKNHSEYDFIIIGAGSAGATIASRLSELKKAKVLLIEAGSNEYPIMDIPFIAPALQKSDIINWKYETEPSSSYCLGMVGSKCQIPRGKVVGGSSVLNYMIATRGNKKDFDGWADESGDSSWSYKKILKYFKKLENFTAKVTNINRYLHGFHGPIDISSSTYRTELAETFIKAGREMDFSTEDDYNGNKQIGFSYFQSTIQNGERWSTNRAFLHPAKYRKNLFFTSGSHVNKIFINPVTKVAHSVKFSKSGKIYIVKARKEIILCAGAINSPQILMLSGIGPANHLRDLGINVIQDTPVGENLMDHIGYGGLVFKVNDSASYNDINLLDPENPALSAFVNYRTGPFVLNGGFEALSYVNVDNLNPLDENPNVELLFSASKGIADPSFGQVLGIIPEYRQKMFVDKFNHSAWTVFPMLMHPKSRGKILLRSNNPYDKPRIYTNYLSDPNDVKTIIKGIRFVMKLSGTNAFKKFGSELYEVPLPCKQHKYNSDQYWECAARTYTLTIYHPSGTCKMGKENDKSAVVNSNLQVKGIKGLRVADASIMPKIVSAHPNIAVIAIGEKVSDLIKKLYRYQIY